MPAVNDSSNSGDKGGVLTRRGLLVGLGAAIASVVGYRLWAAAAASTTPAAAPNQTVPIEQFSASGKSQGAARVAKVVRSEAEWQAQLSPLAYRVARQAGTEAPFSGEYASNHADGIYHCVCCATPLYDSKTKFESGTGWPSFWQPISRLNVIKSSDRSLWMERDAISCALCDAHLGHVFADGPEPTGLRYCMNSVALSFAARG